jgi:hypothetical protein
MDILYEEVDCIGRMVDQLIPPDGESWPGETLRTQLLTQEIQHIHYALRCIRDILDRELNARNMAQRFGLPPGTGRAL